MNQQEGEIPRTHIKICGVTRREDISWLAKLPIDFVGLNFHPASPRHVTVAQARLLAAELPPEIPAIGVFVDRPLEEVRAIVEEVGLAGIQLHGQESPTDASSLAAGIVVKAFKVKDQSSLDRVDTFINAWTPTSPAQERHALLDAFHPMEAGGTGKRWDWTLAGAWRPRISWFLAGGLNPENIREAITFFRPQGVDIASGVESAPGIKDQSAVRRLIDEVRRADESSTS